jgi:RimJ/RimL family protein N-acetyltransferase
MFDEVRLETAANSDRSYIVQMCIKNGMACYMSRFVPDINSKLYGFDLIKYCDERIGAICLEHDREDNDVLILGIVIWNAAFLDKGIGNRIIKGYLGNIKDFRKVKLNVREGNGRAIRSYMNIGFRVVGEGEKMNKNDKIKYLSMEYNVDDLKDNFKREWEV